MTNKAAIGQIALGWFTALRNDHADEAVWLAFQEWLEADPANVAAYDDVERLWLTLDDLGAPAAANVDPVILSAQDRARPSRRLALVSAMAAALVGAVGLGVWVKSPTDRTIVYRADVSPLDVVLEDGSTLALNRHSEVRVDLGEKTRRVSLERGEADFDVVHDPARPFVVEAGSRRVEVLGTAFDIVNTGERFSIAVSRGLVAVTPAGGLDSVRLPAGSRLEQTGQTRPVVVAGASPGAADWRRGVLVYRNRDLEGVAADLSRYFDKQVTVSPSAADLTFTGTLRIDDEAIMLRQLEGFLPVQAERAASEIRLTRRDRG